MSKRIYIDEPYVKISGYTYDKIIDLLNDLCSSDNWEYREVYGRYGSYYETIWTGRNPVMERAEDISDALEKSFEEKEND